MLKESWLLSKSRPRRLSVIAKRFQKVFLESLRYRLVLSIWTGLILCYVTSFSTQAAPLISVEKIQKLAQSYQGDTRKRFTAWGNLIDSLKKKPVKIQPEKVNSFFNQFNYETDPITGASDDYWKSPVEFIVDGGGDCEDFAIIKYFTLVAVGVPSDQLRITYAASLTLNQAHMVLSFYPTPESEPLILDSLESKILKASARPDLKPVYSFNAEGLWLAKTRGESSLMGDSKSLGKWDALMKRME
ncbi:TPA: transglutaminase-like cysteine peptidase [Legionella pneumophila]|nr:transglutaminase-like cysteine peptidase [Legionella pneumophila]